MYFADTLTLDAPKRLKDGYLAVRARASRTGVYQYSGAEVDPDNRHGLRDQALVNVLRDEATVFDAAAVRSFIGKPVTNDHPTERVTVDNWKRHARGMVMGAIRDGEYLAFDLILTDASAIAAVDAGKRELSNGYSAELEFGTFKAADGTVCQARQSRITDGNHVAIVDRGRAGPDCSIADAAKWAACDAIPAEILSAFNQKEPAMAGTITVDGLPISLADEAAVRALVTKLQDAANKAKADLADATTQISTLTGEKTALETKLADAEAKAKPEALDRLVADRAALVAKAKAVKADIVIDGKTDADIRRDVVAAKIGDAAKDMDDAGIAGAFAVLTADAKADTGKVVPLNPATFADTATVRDAIRAARYA